MKTIEITVLPTGKTVIATNGFAGSECQQATKDFEAALGIKEGERLTAEYYQTKSTNHNEAKL